MSLAEDTHDRNREAGLFGIGVRALKKIVKPSPTQEGHDAALQRDRSQKAAQRDFGRDKYDGGPVGCGGCP